MKQELEKLGFKGTGIYSFRLSINEFLEIEICNEDEVWINNENGYSIFFFKYNYEKIKQLIEILK